MASAGGGGGGGGGAPQTVAIAAPSRDLDEDDAMLLECATHHNMDGSRESDIDDIDVSEGLDADSPVRACVAAQ